MANRFTQYTPQEFTSLYTEIPYSAIAEVGAYKDKQFNEGQQAVSEFENLLNVPSLDPDTPIKKQRIKYYEDELQKSLDNTKGDYSTIIPTVARLKRELGKDLRDGELGAIANSYAKNVEDKKRLNELVDKKLIDSIDAEKRYTIDTANYKGIGTPNALGRYNIYQGNAPAEQVKLSEEADKLAKDWKANSVANGSVRFNTAKDGLGEPGKYLIKTDGSNEVVSEQEIYNNILPMMLQDHKISAYAKQQAEFDSYGYGKEQQGTNGDPSYYQIGSSAYPSKEDFHNKYANSLIQEAAKFGASKYGFQKTSFDKDAKSDDYARDASKAARVQQLLNPIIPSGELQPVNTEGKDTPAVDPLKNFKNLKFTKEGNADFSEPKSMGKGTFQNDPKKYEEFAKIIAPFKASLPANSPLKNGTQEQLYKALSEAITNNTSTSDYTYSLQGIDIDHLSESVFGDKNGVGLLDGTIIKLEDGTTFSYDKSGDNTNIIQGLKLNTGKGDAKVKNPFYGIRLENLAPTKDGALKGSVVGTDGVVRNIEVSQSPEQRQYFQSSTQINNHLKNLDFGIHNISSPIPGIKRQVVVTAEQSPSGTGYAPSGYVMEYIDPKDFVQIAKQAGVNTSDAAEFGTFASQLGYFYNKDKNRLEGKRSIEQVIENDSKNYRDHLLSTGRLKPEPMSKQQLELIKSLNQ